jgi:hypothetical protein
VEGIACSFMLFFRLFPIRLAFSFGFSPGGLSTCLAHRHLQGCKEQNEAYTYVGNRLLSWMGAPSVLSMEGPWVP